MCTSQRESTEWKTACGLSDHLKMVSRLLVVKLWIYCSALLRIGLICAEEVGEEESRAVSNGADVEYTEVVHPQPGVLTRGKLLDILHTHLKYICFARSLLFLCEVALSPL